MAILELAQVSLQVLLRNPNVSPANAPFHVRPKRLDRARVNVAAHIFLRRVIDRFVLIAVAFGQRLVAASIIRVNLGTGF